MKAALSIIRYKNAAIPFGWFSMALFRLPLYFNRRISFFKLMGTGLNGTFDIKPDIKTWAILVVYKNGQEAQKADNLYLGKFIQSWFSLFAKEQFSILLEPIAGHGLWDGRNVFGELAHQSDHKGMTATLTRATIRPSKLLSFWKNVAPVAKNMKSADGYLFSVGIGEVPWLKQATFSVWRSMDQMKAFAYKQMEHAEVIKKTRKENWYKEDMFVRFSISDTYGTTKGINPLNINP